MIAVIGIDYGLFVGTGISSKSTLFPVKIVISIAVWTILDFIILDAKIPPATVNKYPDRYLIIAVG